MVKTAVTMGSRRLPLQPLALLLVNATMAHAQSTGAQEQIDPGIATKAVREQPAIERPRRDAVIETGPAKQVANLPTRIMAGAIRVDGGEGLPIDEMTAAISSYIGHALSQEDLQNLLTAVSGVARAHGYLFAHSAILPQTMTAGVLHVTLDKGRIDEIRQTGTARPEVAKVLDSLRGQAPMRAELERKLMLANDLPGVSVGKARYAIENGKGVLIVPVSFQRVTGNVSADNRGLQSLGPERLRVTVNANSLLVAADQLTVQGIITPLQPRELAAIFGRYAIQPNDAGTELSIYATYGETHLGGAWRPLNQRGESTTVGISVTQPLLRRTKTSLWLTLQTDLISSNERYNGVLARRDKITTVSASINGYAPLAGGRWRAGGTVTQGLLALGATDRTNPLASRVDAGSDFTLVNLWTNWQGTLSGPISARLAVTGQISSDPLPAVEQLTIGGSYFGRGFNWSERSGDEGVVGSAELRAQLLNRNQGWLRWAQLYGFADAGYVSNLKTDFGTGDLYSAGGGIRLAVSHQLSLELEAAFPINTIRYDGNDQSPRLSFNLSKNF